MELKSYQNAVMRDLSAYLSILDQCSNIDKAWRQFWKDKDIAVGTGGVPGYNEAIKGVPHKYLMNCQKASRKLLCGSYRAIPF